ncbi:MAG: hypothetical protein HQ559_01830 [Lentisphaerae bacterium]|nr:hypothetical protein [Lentisphaerota bacterium]
MGCRGQVKVVDDKGNAVFLYTHHGAEELASVVADVIQSGAYGRLDDEEYLARIIFDEMKFKDAPRDTCFGIGTQIHTDIEVLVVVDVGKQELTVDRSMWGDGPVIGPIPFGEVTTHTGGMSDDAE